MDWAPLTESELLSNNQQIQGLASMTTKERTTLLLAVFRPEYQCLWASVRTNGHSPNSAIWQKSDLKSCGKSFEYTTSKSLAWEMQATALCLDRR